LPHGLGDDAEHGAAVQAKGAVVEDVEFDGAEFHVALRRALGVILSPPWADEESLIHFSKKEQERFLSRFAGSER
jgi:hypothetical protein